jgi:branched-subunit amino acid aminotransferase/4-amino-4-deoxychorismate lyase
LKDLASADAVYLCNAVRGCRKVTVVDARSPLRGNNGQI